MSTLSTKPEVPFVRGYPEQPTPDRSLGDMLEGIKSAALEIPTLRLADHFSDAWQYPVDRNYLLDEKELKRLGEGIDQARWPAFADAKSRDHAEKIRTELLLRQAHEQAIANAGFVGTAASVAANVLDPVTLGSSFLTGGLGEIGAAASIATKIPRLVKAGLIAAVPNAALAAAEASIDPTMTGGDVVSAAISGAVQGAAGASVGRGVGRIARGLREGVGAAAGAFVAEPVAFSVDPNRSMDLAAPQIALQGVIGAVGGALHRPDAIVEKNRRDIIRAAAQYVKDSENDFINDNGLVKTTEGEAYYYDSNSQTRFDSNVSPLIEEHRAAIAESKRLLLEDLRDSESEKKGSPVPPVDGEVVDSTTAKDPFAKTHDELLAMQPDELQNLADQMDARDVQIIKKYIPDFNRDSARNLPENTRQFLEDNASPEDFRVLFQSQDPQTLRGMVNSAGGAETATSASDLAEEMSLRIMTLKDVVDGKPLTDKQLEAVYFLRRANDIVKIRGYDGQAVSQEAVDIVSKKLGKDAPEILDRFAKATEQQPSTPPQPDITPPGVVDGGGGGGGPSNLGKQPWEMTPEDFGATVGTATLDIPGDHLAWLQYALDNGYIIPAEILNSYPELKAQGPGGGGTVPPTTGVGGGVDLPVPRDGSGESGKGGKGGKGGGSEPPKPPKKGPFDADFSRVNDAPPAMNVRVGGIRISRPFEAITELLMNRRNNNDPNKPFVSAISRLGNMLFPDRMAKDGGPSVSSAPEWKRNRVKVAVAAFDAEMEDAYAQHLKYAKENGAKQLTWSEFEREAGVVTRDLSQMPSDPGIKRAIDIQRQAYSSLLAQAKRHDGLLENLDYEEGWLPRVDDPAKYDQFMREFGKENVERVLQLGIKAVRPQLTDDQALNLARAKIRMATDQTAASSYSKARWLQYDQVALLRNALNQLGLSNAEAENIIGALHAKSSSLGKVFNPRIDMDEGASVTVNGKTLYVYDLFENNARTLFHRYASDAYGHMAMREIHRVFSSADRFINSNDELLQVMEQNARASGADQATIRHDLEVFRYGLNNLMGVHNRPGDAKAESIVRTLKSINFVRTLSGLQTGLNNLGESSEIVFNTAFGVGMRHMPSVREIITQLRTGEADRQLVREIMSMGLGVERASSMPVERVGEDFSSIRTTSYEHNLARLRRVSADLSGQSYGQDAMSLAAGIRVAQQWMDAAASGDVPSQRRLADLGVTREELDRVNSQLKKYAKLDKDGMLWASNFHKWDDVQAAAIFRETVANHANKLIFSSGYEERSRWMTHWFGQLVTELKNFMYGSWSAKTLRAVQLRDVQAAGAIVANATIAGLLYAANTHLYSIGRQDRREFLDDRLSTDKIMKAAFSRSGYSSILPAVWDTGIGLTGRDPTFSYARTSGIMGGLFKTPTMDMLDKSYRAARGIIASGTNDEYFYSKADARNLRDVLVPPTLKLHSLFDYLARDLPDRSSGE